MEVAAGLMLAGTVVNVFGQVKEANDRADAEQQAAELKRIESKEILDRAKINTQELLMESDTFQANQIGGYAAGNVDVTTGSPLIAMEQTHSFYQKQITNLNREAKFRAQQDMRAASSLDDLSGQTRQAGTVRAIGSVLTGASSAYGIMKK